MRKAVMSLYLKNKSFAPGWKQLADNAVTSFMYCNKGYDGYIFAINDFQTEKALSIIQLFESGYDSVVCLDADTFTIAECTELDNVDIDIFGTLNIPNLCHTCCTDLTLRNGDKITSDTGNQYINAGVLCFNNNSSVLDWWFLNSTNPYNVWEQDYINLIFHSGKYKTLIVDESNVCYNETGRGQWQQRLYYQLDNKFVLQDSRQLKILHWAGGYDKSHFHVQNAYLKALSSPLSTFCMDILKHPQKKAIIEL